MLSARLLFSIPLFLSLPNPKISFADSTSNAPSFAMNRTCETILRPGLGVMASDFPSAPRIEPQINPQSAILDLFVPGFSLASSALSRYLKIDLNVYIPIFLFIAAVFIASQYFNEWIWKFADSYLMSTADIRIDDEMYNMIMSWVASQQFSKKSRRFVANTNLNSRAWFLWDYNQDEDEDQGVEFDNEGNPIVTSSRKKNKQVQFTPSFGTHYFWYKKRLLIFRRTQDTRQGGWMTASEREEISISSFGRNPTILKELLDECRIKFSKNDENRTIIYRGGMKTGTGEPTWTRCVSRVSRPFSTVVLDEEVKKGLLDDMRDYLHPLTRRWYGNRGIPYRRGYLFYGFPGTGKSSLSQAVAGYFKLHIYIVSLNSPAMNEENLSTLFSELPKQCVVLLEDIDTAGLTHARDKPAEEEDAKPPVAPKGSKAPTPPPTGGKISLSALLNILDGVASQEGRVLIMTTNHIEKLDEALIRPGRIDMTIKFGLANTQMITTIFKSIFATLEGDTPPSKSPFLIRPPKSLSSPTAKFLQEEKEREELEKELIARKNKEDERVAELGLEIAKLIPGLTFSPAEIQGFFLKHKRQPEVAVREAKGWVEKTLKEKKDKEEKEKKVEEVAEVKTGWGWSTSL